VSVSTGDLAYLRWASLVTVFLYTAGYATVGFALFFFGALWSVVRRRSFPWCHTPLDVPLAILGGVLLASALASPYRPLALGVTFMVLASGAVYFGSFTSLLSRDPVFRTTLLRVWAAGAVPAAVVGILLGVVLHNRAFIPHGVGPNGLGTTLALGGILQLGLAFRARGGERAVWLACGLVSLAGLLATASRASLAGGTVGAAYLTWQELRAFPRRRVAALAGGAVLLVVAGALAAPLVARVRTTVSDISQNRIVIWRVSLGMIASHPLLGTGFGTFEQAYGQVKTPEMSPEPFAFDLALNVAVETGILGLFAALWLAAVAVKDWMNQGRRGPPGAESFRPIISALWMGLLVDQLADNTLFSISTSAALWLLLAFLVTPTTAARPQSGAEIARWPGVMVR
jgi:O-antigen ligase